MQIIQESGGSSTAAANQKFLTFRLGKEEYGINVLAVEEIYGFDTITMTGAAPEFSNGRSIVKLGDRTVPVIDVRPRPGLCLVSPGYQRFTTVIILNLSGWVIGMAVDGVSGIMCISSEQIKPVSGCRDNLNSRCFLGLGEADGRTFVLLDATKLILAGLVIGMAVDGVNAKSGTNPASVRLQGQFG